MITKLYEEKYNCKPAASPKASEGGAAGAPQNLRSAKPAVVDDEHISDDYDDDFDDFTEDKKKSEAESATKKANDA